MTSLTQEALKERLSYDPATGIFTWKQRPLSQFKCDKDCRCWNTRYADKPAGTKQKDNGYIQIRINGTGYLAHRLAHLYMIGEFPTELVDHGNHIRTDNRWDNLTGASHAQNVKNTAISSRNKSGVLGVFKRRDERKWTAQIGTTRLGMFDSFDAAVTARKEAEKTHGYHPNHGQENRHAQ